MTEPNRPVLCIALICASACFLANIAHAQDQQPEQTVPDTSPQTVPELVKAAYDATQSAKTLDDYNAALAVCQRILDKQPNDETRAYVMRLSGWLYNARGEAYSEQAKTTDDGEALAELDAKALSDFQESVRRDPTRWRAVHNRGVSFAMSGEYAKALADFNRTMELNPKFANAWFNRGEIYYQQGQYADAITDYTKALQLDNDDPLAHSARAHAYYQLRQYPKALSDYNKAVQLSPENAEYLADRADIHASMGAWQQAADDYRRAVRLNDSLGRAYMGAAWVMATCPQERFRDEQLAIESANKAIELDGDADWRYLDTLAAAQASAGQYDQAQKAIRQAIEKAPAEQAVALKKRQSLYADGQPYRDAARTATTP